MKLNTVFSAGAVCSAAMLATLANAQDNPIAEQTMMKDDVAEESALSGWVSLDANSHFMSYGANVWGNDTKDIGDHTLFNPSAGLEYSLGDLGAVYVGMWMDINDLADGDIKNFQGFGDNVQELDLWIGYYFTVDKLTVDFTLQSWLYAGENEGIFDVTFSYDMMFAPYFKIHNRFEAVGDQQKGQMYEIGGTLYEGALGDSFSYGLPIGVGFNFNDYHVKGQDGYAYSFIGATGSYVLPIDFLGEWDVHGGLTYYNTDKNNTGNSEDGYLTASFGVGLSF